MYCCWWALLEALLEKRKKKFCYLKFENYIYFDWWSRLTFFQYMNTRHVDVYHGVFRINAEVKAKTHIDTCSGKMHLHKSIHARTLTNKHVHVGISALHRRPHRLRNTANLSLSSLSYWLIKCHFTGRFEIQLWSYSQAKGSRRGRPINSFQLNFISFLRSKPEPWLFYFVSRRGQVTLVNRCSNRKDKFLLTQSYKMKEIKSPQIHLRLKCEFLVMRRSYTYSRIITR